MPPLPGKIQRMAERKNVLLKVSPELHKDLKILVTLRETTLQDYIMGLIEKDMAKNKEA